MALLAFVGWRNLEALPDLCLFHRWTGLPCPGCGLARSLAAACCLDFPAAFRFHAFGPFLALGLLAWGLNTWLGLAIGIVMYAASRRYAR